MKDRMKEMRKSFSMTQQEFADKLNMSRNFIAQIEMGTKVPSERTIKDICREFNINEEWLRTGIGEMFLPHEDEEAAYVSELLEDDNDFYDLIKAIMKTYTESGEKEKTILKSFAQNLKNNLKKDQD